MDILTHYSDYRNDGSHCASCQKTQNFDNDI